MIVSFLYGLLAVLVILPLAVMTWHWMLRALDHRSRINWDNARDKILEESLAAGIYFGCRLLAVAIVVSAIFGKLI